MPLDAADPHARIAWLEGMRGLAAMQVFLLHAVAAFLPAWQSCCGPVAVLWDGHTAVFVFFLLSGAVLTPAFARAASLPAQVPKRLVRLLPAVAVAAIVAALLLAALPDAHRRAGAVAASQWLVMDSAGPATAAQVLREVAAESLFIGYAEVTVLPRFLVAHLGAVHLAPDSLSLSLNAPFWSLQWEFFGSLLVLALTALRRRGVRWHAGGAALALVVLAGHPLALFVIGHLAAPWLRRPPRARWATASGFGLLALGVALCAHRGWAPVEALRAAIDGISPTGSWGLYQFECELAALALFAAPLLAEAPRRVLTGRLPLALGRLSFAFYLLHFPILFTLGCVAYLATVGVAPVLAPAAGTGAALVLSLGAAALLERWVDRPAIRLSRRIG